MTSMQVHQCAKLISRINCRPVKLLSPAAVSSPPRSCGAPSTQRTKRSYNAAYRHHRHRTMKVSATQQETSVDQVSCSTKIEVYAPRSRCSPARRLLAGQFCCRFKASSEREHCFTCLQAFTLVGSGRVGTALAKLGTGSDVF